MTKALVSVLVIALILLAAACVVLYAVGGSVQVCECSVVIDATPGEVFTWLTEPEKLTRWREGYAGSEALNEPGLYVGARSKEQIDYRDRQYVLTRRIAKLEPGRLLAVELDSGEGAGFSSIVRYELEAAGGGTRLTGREETTYRGVLPRIFALAVTKAALEKRQADLATLKQKLESPPVTQPAERTQPAAGAGQ